MDSYPYSVGGRAIGIEIEEEVVVLPLAYKILNNITNTTNDNHLC